MTKFDLIVTRHEGLLAYLRDIGITAPCMPHAGPEEVTGKHVVGILPMRLAALCASYTEARMDIPRELRGVELTLEQVRALEPVLTQYSVATADSVLADSVKYTAKKLEPYTDRPVDLATEVADMLKQGRRYRAWELLLTSCELCRMDSDTAQSMLDTLEAYWAAHGL